MPFRTSPWVLPPHPTTMCKHVVIGSQHVADVSRDVAKMSRTCRRLSPVCRGSVADSSPSVAVCHGPSQPVAARRSPFLTKTPCFTWYLHGRWTTPNPLSRRVVDVASLSPSCRHSVATLSQLSPVCRQSVASLSPVCRQLSPSVAQVSGLSHSCHLVSFGRHVYAYPSGGGGD